MLVFVLLVAIFGVFISSAFIRLEDRYSNNLDLVKHELGHALGLRHSYDSDNIMYKHPMR